MERSSTTPSTFSFTKPFEQLPLFSTFVNGERLSAALVDGTFEVTASTVDGTWWLSDIWLEVENFKMGTSNRSAQLNLNADTDERLYLSILDSLTEAYCDLIDEEIADELAMMGIRVAA
jgi:hypothetical protein